MYYCVLEDAEGYRAGDVLDLGDAELAAQIGRRVPMLRLATRPVPVASAPIPQAPVLLTLPEPAPTPVWAPLVIDKPKSAAVKRRKRG